jgi:nicotinamide-nucleotide adenylyltransferase
VTNKDADNTWRIHKFSRGLFIGRFQPVHHGHLKYIRRILTECDHLVLLIGSSQEAGTEKNPFDYRLRKRMLLSSLKDYGLDKTKFTIAALPDYPTDEDWYRVAIRLAGRIDRYYAGENKITAGIFKSKGIFVKTLRNRIDGLSGTRIRSLLKQNKSIEGLVTDSVKNMLTRNK